MSHRFTTVICSILVLSLARCNQAQDTSTSSEATLLSVPSEQELLSGISKLKELYAADYQRTQDNSELLAEASSRGLARKLLETAVETPAGSDAYYPMLSEVVRLAIVGNDCEIAFEAIGRLTRSHSVNAWKMRLDVLQHFESIESRLADVRTAGQFILSAVQGAANAQELDTAQSILKTGEVIAKRLVNLPLQKDIAQATELLTALQRQEIDVVAALGTVRRTPDDADANLTIAKFAGLRKGDWERAEAYAARVDEDSVRSLFIREFAAPEDVKEILRLANDWWDFAETQSGAVKLQATELASARYTSILADLKGFDKKQAETRLADVNSKHVIAVRVPLHPASTPEATKVKGRNTAGGKLVPIYSLRRTLPRYQMEAYFYTPSINDVATFLREHTSSDIRASLGILGYAYTSEQPSTRRLLAYRDRRDSRTTRTHYTVRKIHEADLPLGVTHWKGFQELWVARSRTEETKTIPIYRLLHENGRRECFVTDRTEFIKLKEAWHATEKSQLGGSGLAFRLFVPKSDRRPVYGIKRHRKSIDWTSFIYTTNLDNFTEIILSDPDYFSMGVIGYAPTKATPDSVQLYVYSDRRDGSGKSRGMYSMRKIPLDLLPKGVLPTQSQDPIFVLRNPGAETHPVYRVIHANGRRQLLTSDEQEFLRTRKEWDARDGEVFGETGIAFHLYKTFD